MKQAFITLFTLFSVGAYAQMICDDLTNIPVYHSGQSSTIQAGDVVSVNNAHVTIIIDSASVSGSSHFFQSNSHPEISGITGDNRLIIMPTSAGSVLYIDGYQTAAHTENRYYEFYIEGMSSNLTTDFGHTYDDFPMVVNGVTVSLDTLITINTSNPNDHYFRMTFEDLGTNELRLESSMHMVLNKICVGDYNVGQEEVEQRPLTWFMDGNKMLNIDLEAFPEGEIFVLNIQGKVIYQMPAAGTSKLDMSKEPEGVYVLQVISGNQVFTEKMILN